jgi:hypothetical protein
VRGESRRSAGSAQSRCAIAGRRKKRIGRADQLRVAAAHDDKKSDNDFSFAIEKSQLAQRAIS